MRLDVGLEESPSGAMGGGAIVCVVRAASSAAALKLQLSDDVHSAISILNRSSATCPGSHSHWIWRSLWRSARLSRRRAAPFLLRDAFWASPRVTVPIATFCSTCVRSSNTRRQFSQRSPERPVDLEQDYHSFFISQIGSRRSKQHASWRCRKAFIFDGELIPESHVQL
eukprot:1792049-Pleurochrysis_carterae.AAC.3